MSAELHRVEWDHPVLGRISETACMDHERVVLRALNTLGIGCGGTLEQDGRSCDRCQHADGGGARVRAWLSERVK
jgi:hypothetical protein